MPMQLHRCYMVSTTGRTFPPQPALICKISLNSIVLQWCVCVYIYIGTHIWQEITNIRGQNDLGMGKPFQAKDQIVNILSSASPRVCNNYSYLPL